MLAKKKEELEQKEIELDDVRLNVLAVSLKKAREMKGLRLEFEKQADQRWNFQKEKTRFKQALLDQYLSSVALR